MICTNCKRRLRATATSCICGKFGSEAQDRRPMIQCCFEGCANNANVRMFTKTGWVNVCARVDRTDTTNVYHYDQIERAPRPISNPLSNPFVDACRKAYSKKSGTRIVGAIAESLP